MGGALPEWLNIFTLIAVNVIFFIGAARITGYKLTIFQNTTITGILLAIACSVLFFLLLDNFLDPIFDRIFPASAIEYEEMLITLRKFPAATFIRVCLFAPITEEILMRGFVLGGLQKKYGVIIALVVSTLLFAILHFNFVQTLSAVVCGLVLGLLYIKTGSLFCPILAHVLYNSISYYTVIIKGGVTL